MFDFLFKNKEKIKVQDIKKKIDMKSIYASYEDYIYLMKYLNCKRILLPNIENDIKINENSSELFEITNNHKRHMVLPSPIKDLSIIYDYGFSMKLIKKDGSEVDGCTEIKIKKYTSDERVTNISNMMYINIRYGYATKYHPLVGIELRPYDSLKFLISDYKVVKDIDITKSKLYAYMDVFIKE